jgi:nucleoside-diphosphate-sugar epimerase
MSVLITGGAGALGLELAHKLSRKRTRTRIFDLPNVDYDRVHSLKDVEIFEGDITIYSDVRDAVRGVDRVVHLAALLPPASELSEGRTQTVNVGGTENVVKALRSENEEAVLVFASSVCVYGLPGSDEQYVSEEHALEATDYYSRSKIRCEQIIRKALKKYVIVRISGVTATEFFELPEVLQFTADQRIEFVTRGDVADAIISSMEHQEAWRLTMNIAGGETWQMRGGDYISRICDVMEIPSSNVTFAKKRNWFGWYDTAKARATLDYRPIPFNQYLRDLRKSVRRAYGYED